MTHQRIALYPGSFDPITNGHVDIIRRASCLFDQFIVSIAVNDQKKTLFSIEERLAMIHEEVASYDLHMQDRLNVITFDGLLVDLVRTQKAQTIVRGLRSVSDFEYEFQMASMNSCLSSQIDTIFLMASDKHRFVAARLVKEIARLGGDISAFVPPHVAKRLYTRFTIKTES